MNVAYLKVTFFFFSTGLLMSFHGHSCPSIIIICIQPQTWGGSGRGYGNGTSLVFFWATGMVPPRDLVPYANCVLCIYVLFISHRHHSKGRGLEHPPPPHPCTPLTENITALRHMHKTSILFINLQFITVLSNKSLNKTILKSKPYMNKVL